MGACDGVRNAVYEGALEECRAEVEAMRDRLSSDEVARRLELCQEEANERADRAYRRCRRTEAGVGGEADQMVLDCMEAGFSWEMCAAMVFGGPTATPAPVLELERPDRTLAVRRELFDDPAKVKAISTLMVKAFDQIGLKLKDDETWACLLFVITKPSDVSQLLPSAGALGCGEGMPRMHYVLEPGFLSKAYEAMQRDKPM
jgi:hypothetical protein